MKKQFILFFVLTSATLFATDRHYISTKALPMVIDRGNKIIAKIDLNSQNHPAGEVGPGTVLIPASYFEVTTNSSVMPEIIYHTDGTMQVATMAQPVAEASARSTYYTYYNGVEWTLPVTRVETQRSGWGTLASLNDGRAVIASHVSDLAVGIRISVDTATGVGSWNYYSSGQFPNAPDVDLSWPRFAVDEQNNFHLVCSYFSYSPFTGFEPRAEQVYLYGCSINGGETWSFHYLFQDEGAAPTDPPSRTVGWLTDGDADAYAIDTWQNKVGIIAWTWNNPDGYGMFRGSDILFAESEDHGNTWTYTNITGDGLKIPQAGGEPRAGEQMALVYDNNGIPHAVFGTFYSFPDTLEDGTVTIGQNRAYSLAPLYHWSPEAGITYILDRTGIPGAIDDIRALLNYGGCEHYQRGSGAGLWWPAIAVDTENNLYITFTAPTPFDVNADTVNYTDIYATASKDGGLSWGCPPVNITNSQGTEDKIASIAKLVDDSIRIVYLSDDVIGWIGSAEATQTTPTSLLYLAYHVADIPTDFSCDTKVEQLSTPVPERHVLYQNYPNPFNPQTQIRFQLSNIHYVSLKIYNVHGQNVATLVDGVLQAGGHTISWTAPPALASGVYFYRLQTPGFTTARKLILLQ